MVSSTTTLWSRKTKGPDLSIGALAPALTLFAGRNPGPTCLDVLETTLAETKVFVKPSKHSLGFRCVTTSVCKLSRLWENRNPGCIEY